MISLILFLTNRDFFYTCTLCRKPQDSNINTHGKAIERIYPGSILRKGKEQGRELYWGLEAFYGI